MARKIETPLSRARTLIARSRKWYDEANRIVQAEYDRALAKQDYNTLQSLVAQSPDCVAKALMLVKLRERHEARTRRKAV